MQAAMVTPTQAALTDSSGGTAATTIAAITETASAGSADTAPVANAIAQLAKTAGELKVDVAAIIAALKAAGLMASA